MRTSKPFILAASLAFAPMYALAQSPVANPAPAAIRAGDYKVEPTHTRIQFSVSHMGFTDWYGDFTHASGSLSIDPKAPDQARVRVSIPVSSISTTNATLDDELKGANWFDAETYPTITFNSTRVTPTGERAADITGNLTFHGVTRPVVLHATYLAGGVNPLDKHYTIGFNATTVLNRSDFDVKTYVPLIGDQVSVRISAAFEKSG